MKHVTLVTGQDTDKETLKQIEASVIAQIKDAQIVFRELSKPDRFDAESLHLLYLDDAGIKQFLLNFSAHPLQVAILPKPTNPYAIRSFGIATDLYEAIEDALTIEASPVDLLRCNGEIVFESAVIGEVHGLNRRHSRNMGVVRKLAEELTQRIKPVYRPYTITTAKGSVTDTAATGIMCFEHNISGLSHNILKNSLSLHDGKLHALILAPKSVLGHLYYLLTTRVFNELLLDQLPGSVGLIASSNIKITGSSPIAYAIDGERRTDTTLTLDVTRDAFRIVLGRHMIDIPYETTADELKETIKVQSLPKGEMVPMLISEPLPFIRRAGEEDFKELFVGLRQSAKLSGVFITLMILSTLLATTGLFQNSAPVIIGAMILAPLMAPIISFSMGVVRGEQQLIQESATTLFFGILTALAVSCLYTYMMPLNLLTDEMQGRLHPNVLDLMVAILSGIAGAYAHAKTEVAKSLAGVAIAVALIPPLSVAGIGIGWWETEIVVGSFLLFLTNLSGISLAAALTFLLLGYAPIKRATKGLVLSSIFLAVISIPLVVSFNQLIEQNRIYKQLKSLQSLTVDGEKVLIRTRSIDLSKKQPMISIETHSETALTAGMLRQIHNAVIKVLHQPVSLDITSGITLQHDADHKE